MLFVLLWGFVVWAIGILPTVLKLNGERLPPSAIVQARRWSQKFLWRILALHEFRFRLDQFDAAFGPRFLSWRRIIAVIVATFGSVLLSSMVLELILPPSNYIAIQSVLHYDKTMAVGAAILLTTTLVIDFVSVEKTRRLLAVARLRGAFAAVLVVAADILLTAALFLALFPVGYAVTAVVLGWDEAVPYAADFYGQSVRVTGPGSLFVWSFLHQFIDGSIALTKLVQSAFNAQISATFVRIPAPLTDDEMVQHIVTNTRYPVMSYLYPYAHSFLASFVVVTWSAALAVGSVYAGCVRFGARMLARGLATTIGRELLDETLVTFSVALALFLMIVTLGIVAIAMAAF